MLFWVNGWNCLVLSWWTTLNLKIFVHKNFCVQKFCNLTPLRNCLYKENFLAKKDLVHASSIRLTTANDYQHQSKQARSTLSNKAKNQYHGDILEQRCCVGGSTCIKMHGIVMRAVGGADL